jgi:hypothetical protein
MFSANGGAFHFARVDASYARLVPDNLLAIGQTA